MRDWRRWVRERVVRPEACGADLDSIVEELAAQLEDLYREALDRGRSEQRAKGGYRRAHGTAADEKLLFPKAMADEK